MIWSDAMFDVYFGIRINLNELTVEVLVVANELIVMGS